MTEKVKILIVDDHQIVADGLKSVLEQEENISIVGTANNGKEALLSCKILMPDIVLMDLDMPIMSGSVAAQKIKEGFDQIKVIILSLHGEQAVIKRLIQNGIDAYLIKNSSSNELINAINTVHSGSKYFSSEVTLALTRSHGSELKSTKNASLENQINLLSSREMQILKSIGEGYSNKEIANQLQLSPRTVDSHRANIMKKLEINKVTGLVRFAIKSGLID